MGEDLASSEPGGHPGPDPAASVFQRRLSQLRLMELCASSEGPNSELYADVRQETHAFACADPLSLLVITRTWMNETPAGGGSGHSGYQVWSQDPRVVDAAEPLLAGAAGGLVAARRSSSNRTPYEGSIQAALRSTRGGSGQAGVGKQIGPGGSAMRAGPGR
jgi:hypothetical protein